MNNIDTSTNSTIAVIGTGNMGAPMAINLAAAGFNVNAFDIEKGKLQPLVEHGVTACHSHMEAIERADMILTMLPSGVEVTDVFCQHIFNRAHTDTLLVDSSTIDLKTAQSLHREAALGGYAMIDAPVSGGTAGAESGNLTFMVGGEAASLDRATSVLEAMGAKTIHCGEGGMGQAAKMCNNLMLGIQMISVAEGYRLAQKTGLSEQTLYDVAANSSGNCAALTAFNPIPNLLPNTPSSRDYQPGFSNNLMLKDMKLALNAASQTETPLDIAPVATNLYQKFSDAGFGELDFSAIFNLHEKKQ